MNEPCSDANDKYRGRWQREEVKYPWKQQFHGNAELTSGGWRRSPIHGYVHEHVYMVTVRLHLHNNQWMETSDFASTCINMEASERCLRKPQFNSAGFALRMMARLLNLMPFSRLGWNSTLMYLKVHGNRLFPLLHHVHLIHLTPIFCNIFFVISANDIKRIVYFIPRLFMLVFWW